MIGNFPAWIVIAAILAIVGGPTSAAWIGVRVGMNGLRNDIKELKKAQAEGSSKRHIMDTRLVRIETRLENCVGKWNGRERRQ